MEGQSCRELAAVLRRTLAVLDCGGAELAAGLRDAGAAGDAVDGVVVVPTGPLLLLGLDAVVCASPRRWGRCGSSFSVEVDVETCSCLNLQFVDGGSVVLHADLRHHLGSARVSERDEKEETTDVVLLF